ncbi:hypothetical protein DWX43_17110 [Clostridium sp. AF19-22AC]|jgi:hypothetical protein|uniref:hypothetical protein n=1 Tax=Clostridia TaxID=186801 RepID=UPI000E508DA6|nr:MULTISPECIES: hypothetical protein [Clostridia]RHR25843.1 hypothetical protein DWX43_17110 [Clostridium sp. AF19-22AC]
MKNCGSRNIYSCWITVSIDKRSRSDIVVGKTARKMGYGGRGVLLFLAVLFISQVQDGDENDER